MLVNILLQFEQTTLTSCQVNLDMMVLCKDLLSLLLVVIFKTQCAISLSITVTLASVLLRTVLQH